uniref:proton-coupled folate transporter-like n=1 Tax=Ciona intestinalis TaxID=7719 RepID=UPI000180B896|nr:proton-coupled folate transporter-like [Ciona intestinalis]|eukprot:XP_002119904.3 proton-coupled folate transporter-like [Ciona intestinalis]
MSNPGLRGFDKLRYNLIHVDMIVGFGAFSCLLLDPLKNEYLYMRVAELHNTTKKILSDCTENNATNIDQIVADEVSQWTLYLNLSMFLPACVASILITSWSDKVGRKVTMSISLSGMLLHSILLAIIVKLHLPIPWLLVSNFAAGLGGYYMALLMQGTAYLSDITLEEKRGFRFAILEASMGVGGGVAGICSGYWIEAQGFFNPVLSTMIINISSLLLVPLLLNPQKIKKENKLKEEKESVGIEPINREGSGAEITDARRASVDSAFSDVTIASKNFGSFVENADLNENPEIKPQNSKKYNVFELLRRVWHVYSSEFSECDVCNLTNGDVTIMCRISKCEHGGGWYVGRIWRLWFYILSYDLMMYVTVGCMVFQTIYFLSKPLCFTPVLVGAQLAVKFSVLALSPVLIVVMQKILKMSAHFIILVGLLALSGFCFVMSFAHVLHDPLVFIATSLTLFCNPAKPFIQAKISSLASKYEQGAVFAVVSCTEILMFLVATLSFLTLYPATLSIYHGFMWLYGAGVALIPCVLILVVSIADKRRDRLTVEIGETKPLLS